MLYFFCSRDRIACVVAKSAENGRRELFVACAQAFGETRRIKRTETRRVFGKYRKKGLQPQQHRAALPPSFSLSNSHTIKLAYYQTITPPLKKIIVHRLRGSLRQHIINLFLQFSKYHYTKVRFYDKLTSL